MSATLAAPERIAPTGVATSVKRRERGGLALAGLVIVCCLISACYSVVVPAFEAPDEPGHYAYVQWIASGKGIPVQGQEPLPLQPEFSQPPLYYLVEAPLAWLAGDQPANLPVWEGHHNPFQNRTDYGNVNLYLHSPAEGFPWSGEVLGLHLMRLANVFFVMLMVLATYGCGIELGLAPALAWFAAGTLGLVPQVLFIGGALNADNAIGSLSAASLYLLLRWLNRGPNTRVAVLLGLAAGGAALSKLSGLVTVGLVLGFMGAAALRFEFKIQNSRFKIAAIRDVAAAAAVAALVAGWWYVRNWMALGDPLGWSAMLLSTGDMLRQAPLNLASAALALLRRSYTGLAVFGWTNLPVHPAWYAVFGVFAALSAIGLVLGFQAQPKRRLKIEHWLLLVWPLAFFVSLARWVEVNTAADQWRLLLPAYPAVALLLTIGWRGLVGSRRPALFAVPAGLLALNIGALAFVIVPAYAGPQTYREAIEHPADVHFGDSLELVGYSTPRPLDSKPGDTVEIDFFWRASAPMTTDYATDIGIIDAQKNLTWKELSIPDEGRAPMSAWRPGEIVRDRHRIRVRPEMFGVQSLLLSVIDPQPPGNHLPATSAGMHLENDTVTLTRFMVLGSEAPTPSVRDAIAFQDHVRLVGHGVAQTASQLRVTLAWATDGGVPSKDYTVFVHMITPEGKQIAQHDGQPGGGAFPMSLLTSEAVADTHILDAGGLPAGDYKLDIGLYELASGTRLAAASGESSVVLPITLN